MAAGSENNIGARGVAAARQTLTLNVKVRPLPSLPFYGTKENSFTKEIWKDIEGYEGRYQVSNFGRVYSVVKKIYLKSEVNNHGYEDVVLSKDKHKKHCLVHRLVAMHFLPNPYQYPIVNHKDQNKLNNHADNLEWCTYSYNSLYNDAFAQALRTRIERHHKPLYIYDTNFNLLRVIYNVDEFIRENNLSRGQFWRVIRKNQQYGAKYQSHGFIPMRNPISEISVAS